MSFTTGVPPFSQLARELDQLVNLPYVFLVGFVCFQVKWILTKYAEKVRMNTGKDALKLECIRNEIEQRLDLQEQRFATFQEVVLKNQDIHEEDIKCIQNDTINVLQKDMLKRLSFLEQLFSGLVDSEHKLNSAVAARLRLQVETGGLWGKQLRELQELSRAADERERAWLKATAYSPV